MSKQFQSDRKDIYGSLYLLYTTLCLREDIFLALKVFLGFMLQFYKSCYFFAAFLRLFHSDKERVYKNLIYPVPFSLTNFQLQTASNILTNFRIFLAFFLTL